MPLSVNAFIRKSLLPRQCFSGFVRVRILLLLRAKVPLLPPGLGSWLSFRKSLFWTKIPFGPLAACRCLPGCLCLCPFCHRFIQCALVPVFVVLLRVHGPFSPHFRYWIFMLLPSVMTQTAAEVPLRPLRLSSRGRRLFGLPRRSRYGRRVVGWHPTRNFLLLDSVHTHAGRRAVSTSSKKGQQARSQNALNL